VEWGANGACPMPKGGSDGGATVQLPPCKLMYWLHGGAVYS